MDFSSMKEKKEDVRNSKIRNENGGIITDITEVKGIPREYYEQVVIYEQIT